MPIIVYKMDASPPARTVLITAEILGVNIETRDVDILKEEHLAPKYLEMNPLHTVPVMVDGDFILADSHAIIIYLISKYGTKQTEVLYPSNSEERAIVNQRLFLDASILFPRLVAIEKDIFYGTATSVNEIKATSAKEAYGFLEKYLERSSFLAGENITIADVSCVTTVSTLNIFVPLDEAYPKVQAWFEVLKNKEWYQNLNKPGIDNFNVLLATKLQQNAKQ